VLLLLTHVSISQRHRGYLGFSFGLPPTRKTCLDAANTIFRRAPGTQTLLRDFDMRLAALASK